MCVLGTVIADATAVFDAVNQLADKASVVVICQIALKLEQSYGCDQLLLINGSWGNPARRVRYCRILRMRDGSDRPGVDIGLC